jgi:hypothetical protein
MIARRLTLTTLTSLCLLVGGLLLGAPAMALNVHVFKGSSFGEEGSGNGQFKEPDGVAVNDTTHDVYVVDKGNGRVEEFTASGAYIGQFNGSAAPTGEFKEPTQIAIDNSGNPLDPSAEDVYVIDHGNKVIDKFNAEGTYIGQLTGGKGGSPFAFGLAGVAVDPAGVVWVTQDPQGGEVDTFSDALVNSFLSEGSPRVTVHEGLAVDSEDHLYIAFNGGVNKVIGSTLVRQEELDSTKNVTGIAVDTSTNDVYLAVGEEVNVYQENGTPAEQFGSGDLGASSGDAVDSSSHAVYVADAAADRVTIFDQVVLPDVSTGTEPTNLEHEGSVTLNGTVNPDGEPVTSCQFEYGTEKPSEETAPYEKTAPCEPAPGSGSSPVGVHADITGLTPLTTYHYRLVAGNANGSNRGIDQSFVDPMRPAVDEESVTSVVSNAATLQARVGPGGADTTYRFEYGQTASYGASLPVPDGDAGSGTSDVVLSVRLQSLQPSTSYHFRLVVGNGVQREVVGPDQVFTTQTADTAFTQSDDRAWELVTPPNKQGAGIIAVGAENGDDIQAAAGGGSITYGATAPFVASPAGNRSIEVTQVLSTRGTTGTSAWETADITTPHNEGATELALGHTAEYKLFSNDLSLGVVEPVGDTPLPPLPAGAEKTIYLRAANGEYKALVSTANVPPGTKFGGNGKLVGGIEFVSATPDFSHVVLQSREGVKLTSIPGDEGGGLYEWGEGQLRLASVLPGGQPTPASLGGAEFNEFNVRHAISNDGSRLLFGDGHGHLYLRDMVRGETLEIDAAQGTPEPEGAASKYKTASSDDSRVFFTSSARLTVNSTASSEEPKTEDLYEFELTSGRDEPLAGRLIDLTVDGNVGESADVRNLIGASESGSDVYFVANGALGDGAEHGAKDGSCEEHETPPSQQQMCNLYVEHYDEGTKIWTQPTLIAVLSGGDGPTWAHNLGNSLTTMTARVSPNGRYLVFMSERSLTGYENRDANSGVPDEEVFLYDSAGNGRLVCASCDPTGARPVGLLATHAELLVENYKEIWRDRWLAGNVPGWTTENISKSLYQSRYLSSSGRLFFDSNDALVPADVNGREDVYEYEPAGVGSCQAPGYGQSASVVFGESLGGCVALISAGSSSEESAFMDASETGGDVFFLTQSRLSPRDYDTSIDLYDAHECTVSSPCAAPPPLVPPPCATGDACKAAPTPQPSIFGAPSSATFSGAGNIRPSATHKVVVKSLTRAQRLVKALKACKKDRSKKKRTSCEASARRKYRAGNVLRRGRGRSHRGGK